MMQLFLRCVYIAGIVEKLLLSFSVYTNGKRILSTTHAPGSFGAIHGIRFLSMAWIILGHTYFFGLGHFGRYLRLPFFIT